MFPLQFGSNSPSTHDVFYYMSHFLVSRFPRLLSLVFPKNSYLIHSRLIFPFSISSSLNIFKSSFPIKRQTLLVNYSFCHVFFDLPSPLFTRISSLIYIFYCISDPTSEFVSPLFNFPWVYILLLCHISPFLYIGCVSRSSFLLTQCSLLVILPLPTSSFNRG